MPIYLILIIIIYFFVSALIQEIIVPQDDDSDWFDIQFRINQPKNCLIVDRIDQLEIDTLNNRVKFTINPRNSCNLNNSIIVIGHQNLTNFSISDGSRWKSILHLT